MSCEKPGGPIIDLFVRDANIKFPQNWGGNLPAPASRSELSEQFKGHFAKKGFSEEQAKEALDFLETYESRYHEDMNTSQCYHRACNGGAVVQGETGIFCSKCGKLPDLIPPACLR